MHMFTRDGMIEGIAKASAKAKAKIKATNPYSKQSTMLTPDEHKLYIEIKEHERDEEYNEMQKKLDKFSRLNASAFMVLLD